MLWSKLCSARDLYLKCTSASRYLPSRWHRQSSLAMTTLPRRSTELALPLIGATYAARMTEHIYSHLRDRLDWDEDIEDTIEKIMNKSLDELQGRCGTLNYMAPNLLQPLGEHGTDLAEGHSTTGGTSIVLQSYYGPKHSPSPSTGSQQTAHETSSDQDSKPPCQRDPLRDHIHWLYRDLTRISQKKYLNTIRLRLDRTTSVHRVGFKDDGVTRAEAALEQIIMQADKELQMNLSKRTYSYFYLSLLTC